MQKINTLATVVSLLLLTHTANAAMMTEWGAGARSSTLTCASFSVNCGVGTTPTTNGPFVDNFHNLTADSSVSSTQGSAEGHSQLSGTSEISIPLLTGRAKGFANGIGQAISWGLEGYTYTGENSTIISLNISLSGIINNPSNSGFTSISSELRIVDADEWEDTLSGTTDARGYFNEGLFPIASSFLNLSNTGLTIDTIDFNLDPGDTFYIWAALTVSAGRDATSESLNSLSMSFSDNSNLIAASTSAVPVPAAFWLFGSGLVGLVSISRFKNI